jgi:hypothetical protein
MKSAKTRNAILVLASLFVLTVNVRASGPAGVYAIIEKVTLEPNEAAAERILISGAFSFVQGGIQRPYATSKPQRGSMYFRIPANASEAQKQTIRREWADLKTIAGTGQAVAFGDWFYMGGFEEAPATPGRILANTSSSPGITNEVRVFKQSDPKGDPTAYTTNSGLVKLPATGTHAAAVAELKAALK